MSAALDIIECPRGMRWCKHVLPKQHLLSAVPHLYKCLDAPVFATEYIGSPLILESIHATFRPRPTDVHIVTYPKAGTSWVQEVAWLVNHDGAIDRAKAASSSQRTLYIELQTAGMSDRPTAVESLPQDEPRHIKWHHCAFLLPQTLLEGKVIYLMRNPKDTCVSWYHFQRMNTLYGFTGSFDEFLELFLEDQVVYGSYFANVLSWWKLRQHPNVLILTYEGMHADLPATVTKIAAFLDKSLSSAQISDICAHCSFDTMRENPMTNAHAMPKIAGEGQFLRKGQVGDWTNYFSKEQNARMDAWIERNSVGHDLPLVYHPDAADV